MLVFIFDSSICNGCYNCQLACKDEHVGNEWLPYALKQSDIGQFWCGLKETTHGQVPKVKVEYLMKTCHHCDNAPCMKYAADAFYKRSDGIVILDPAKAGGRRDIVDSCPYGAIWYNDELDVPQKCTGCAHLLDEHELPHCVDLCPTEAWTVGEEEELQDKLKDAVRAGDEAHAGRLYYLNLPGLFIGGEVWDPKSNEIIEGAQICLLDKEGTQLAKTQSDAFGDFWFRKLSEGVYRVRINAAGFKGIEQDVQLDKSLNIGDFPLERA